VRQPTAERIDGDVDLQLLASGNGLGLNGDDAALNEAAPDIVYKLSIKKQGRSPMTNLAERRFSEQDQQRFAAASGDYNPMHVDAMFSRRTQAGAPVVHGLHLLLWTLDSLAANHPNLPPVRKVRVQFYKFAYLNELARVELVQQRSESMRLQVAVERAVRIKVHLEFGDSQEELPIWIDSAHTEFPRHPEALDMPFSSFQGQSGLLPLQAEAGLQASMFPFATRWLGPRAVAALMASTHLVGMVIPGLHSVYSELAVRRCVDDPGNPWLAFRVQEADPRFRTVDFEVGGGGFTGTINAVARTPPVTQATIESLTQLIAPNQFANAVALIIGGSRGLGELTAKIIAAGGGKPIITWLIGRSDAEKVADEIRTAGRDCETLAYDARKSAAPQIASLVDAPTHMYYFATPAIFRPQTRIYDPERLRDLLTVYVDGFSDLVLELLTRCPNLSVFYPSSVAVTERPDGMLEYTMAKATGEILCEEMKSAIGPARITQVRLPRLPTDQTASVVEVETADPVMTMLPIIELVQSKLPCPSQIGCSFGA